MYDFYVYELIDPRTRRPFYVGKGRDNRMYTHVYEARKPEAEQCNVLKCRVINNILSAGLSIQYNVVCDALTEEDAYKAEIELIKQHGKVIDNTGCLTNIDDGGSGGGASRGVLVFCFSTTGAFIKQYSSLSEAARDVGIHKSTICASLNGRTVTAGGYRWSYDFTPINLISTERNVPVDCFRLDGEFVTSYSSITEAAKDINVRCSAIINCCRKTGNNKTAGGFLFSYRGERPTLPTYSPRTGRKLLCKNRDGAVVEEFSTIRDASNKLQINASGISDCCAGRKKSAGGFKWEWIYF